MKMKSKNEYRKTKPNWYRESLNPMGPGKQQEKENYRIRTPWDQHSEELVDEFDQQLNVVDVNVTHPWDEGSYEFQQKEKQKEDAKKYKFQSLFEVPPLSEQKQKQLASYEYNPPFNCGYNTIDVQQKSAKKLNPEVKNPKTRAPWTYGELPAEPVGMKVFERPPTALWDVPKGDQDEKPLESSGDPVLDALRVELKKHGAMGISGLARKFRIMDDDGSGTLDFNEFMKGMKETGLTNLGKKALKHLFLYFDRDDSGSITYDEFLVGVRGVMNERRKGLVKMAFRVLDSDNSGVIDINDIKGVYNGKFHPDVIAGKRTEEEVLLDFLRSFERPVNPNSKSKDPKEPAVDQVTFEDFLEYYQNISASIDEDDYFELVIRNAWHISGGKGQYENTTNRRILVTDVNGNQTIQELKDDIRIKKDDTEAILANLQKQGVENVAYINTNDKLNMKNTIQNPNIVNIRTKYGASDANGGENSAPAPLNAYFNQTMTYGLPKNLSNRSSTQAGAARPVSAGAAATGRLQVDMNAINRGSNNNSLVGSSPMPLNAYAATVGAVGGNGNGNAKGSNPGIAAGYGRNPAPAAAMNVNPTPRGNVSVNSRPSTARSGGSLNRTIIY